MHLTTFAQLLSSAMINGVEQKLSAGSNNLNLSDFLSQSSGNSGDLWERIGGSTSSFTVPCLNLKGNTFSEKTSSKGASLLDDAAMNLSSPLHANKYSIDAVPSTLLSNVTSTMEQLLQSRLRASMIALIKQTMKLGDHNEARILRRLMLSPKAVQITTVVSSFSVLNDNGYGVFGNMSKPLVYELILDITMLGKQHTVSIQVSGDICGVVNSNQLQFDSVTISLDTVSLLEKMMAQARQLIKKTLKRAASITTAYSNMQLKRSREEFERPQPEFQEKKPSAMQEDLSSYPAYFRETCKQFLPDENALTEETMEGFPPQLAKTLKLLANGGGEDFESDEYAGSAQSNQPLISEDSLGMGFFSSATSSQESILRPLKKKKSKVSFSL
ncbi:hypothetical protein CTEN210_17659 [Chaetoceros tenuissimus]|uniref:Uncharacterized protein n=1 Tax=Chaetoceros tenuissimus TaxID=426638 RepID=A0AAD3DB57_9STRA|nr:hypothetical protein CTEN210_17659 [Chaetoceros tenuissimus]